MSSQPIVFVFTFGPSPVATTLTTVDPPADPMRLVFLDMPGPGGGGGGGGLLQKTPPPKAMREGRKKVSSPLPRREPPKAITPVPAPPEPKPAPLASESLPVVVAPIVTAPADNRDRAGVLQQARAEAESHGPGQDGGAGTGRGTGLGQGDGSGVGAGSGGGTGGGPFRPGSGITPPRVLQEVKAEYTDEARRAGIVGEVVLEIVVRRDGSVGECKLLQRTGRWTQRSSKTGSEAVAIRPGNPTRHSGRCDRRGRGGIQAALGEGRISTHGLSRKNELD